MVGAGRVALSLGGDLMRPKIVVGGVQLTSDEANALRKMVAGEVRHLRLRVALAERIARLLQAETREMDSAESDGPAELNEKLRAL
jgi:hypothetical protein